MKKILTLYLLLIMQIIYAQAQEYKISEKKGKYGVKLENNTIIEYKFDSIEYFKKPKIFIVRKKDKLGVYNEKGYEIKPVEYTNIYLCPNLPEYILTNKKVKKGNINNLCNIISKKEIKLAECCESLKIKGKNSFITKGDTLRFIQNKKEGIISVPDKILLKPEYNWIYTLKNMSGTYLLNKDYDWNFYDFENAVTHQKFEVYDERYLKIENMFCLLDNSDFVEVKLNEKYCLINLKGEMHIIEKYPFESITVNVSEDILLTKIHEKYGYMNIKAEIIIPCIYDDAAWFKNGCARIKQNGKWGFINEEQGIIIPPMYDNLEDFSLFDWADATSGDITFKIDKQGVFKEDPELFYDNNEKAGYELKGKIIIKPQFYEAESFNNGFAVVINKDGKKGFITPTGELIIDYKFDNIIDYFESGIAKVQIGKKIEYINFSGEFLSNKKEYKNKLFIVSDENFSFGFINNKGELIADYRFNDAKAFYNGLAPVMSDEKWGYIDINGNIVIDCEYDDAGTFISGYKAEVYKDGGYFFINKKGECIENCP